LGWDHFLVRGFAKVRGEMSLTVLGHNFLRVMNLLGVSSFRDHCARRKQATPVKTVAQLAV